MTIHNAIGYDTELVVGLSKFCGLLEGEEGTVRQSETYQPVFDVFRVPELQHLIGRHMWGTFQDIPAVAGEFGFMGIRNPAGSERIVVVEKLNVVSAGASGTIGKFTVGQTLATDVDAAAGVTARDLRIDIGGFPVWGSAFITVLIGAGAVIQGNPVWTDGAAAVFGEALDADPIVLPPGFECRAYGFSVNLALVCGASGYWRTPNPGEL